MILDIRCLFFVILLYFDTVYTRQCPFSIEPPCLCTSTKYEAISVTCDKATSLDHVLKALKDPKATINSLSIVNTPIEELPAFALDGIQVKRLFFRNNGMLAIHPDAFIGSLSETIEELEIRDNHLEHIPQLGLPSLENLKILTLANNFITKIEDNAFLSYLSRTKIVKLDLSSNNLTYLQPQALLGLESLKQLFLDKNGLTKIPTESLENVQTLEELSLSVNHIEIVEAKSLPLPGLKSLSLEVNQIRQIYGEAFESVPQLAYLYLGNNLFSIIDPTTFFYLKQLKMLSLSHNKDLTEIKVDSFQFLPLLIRLEMSDCSLITISPQAFHKMPKIQVLTLNRNQLINIPAATFSAFTELVSIDLSSNAINYVEDFAFSQLPTLGHLDLSGNRLETLPPHILYDSLHLGYAAKKRTLYLHNNPWRCDDNLQWLRKWLRENGDVQTSPTDSLYARCWTPANLSGLDIRQTDPVRSHMPPKSIAGEVMRKYPVNPPKTVNVPLDPNLMNPELPQISQANLLVIIMGIVFGVVAISLIVIITARYAKPSFSQKTNPNSAAPSINSAFSTTLSGSALFNSDAYRHRSATNANVFLNRPRYWWF
ncbi:unnamed protein product, partial [Mesorhabditis belari]|uniref:LRRCT domain-containing protein n=1 Tax=Mesorhabditis belari TaxID=2138241 RepID=A0AAF3ETI0_9BILA